MILTKIILTKIIIKVFIVLNWYLNHYEIVSEQENGFCPGWILSCFFKSQLLLNAM